jgi:hypothetical protein
MTIRLYWFLPKKPAHIKFTLIFYAPKCGYGPRKYLCRPISNNIFYYMKSVIANFTFSKRYLVYIIIKPDVVKSKWA